MTAEEINKKYIKEFTNDEPLEILEDFFIYPVTMEDFFDFNIYTAVLTLDKNKTKDPKIISMSYLDYLLHIFDEELQEYEEDDKKYPFFYWCFYNLIKIVTKNKYPDINYYKDPEINRNVIVINDCKLNKKQFEELRLSILVQNSPDYNEDYINPELKQDLESASKLRNKNNQMCGIEKQQFAICMGLGCTLEYVRSMTMRKFYIALEMIDKKLHYEMYKQASISGMVEFKEDIKHYLIENNHTLENEVVDSTQFKNKIIGSNN